MSNGFQAGDTVQLKSGGPRMTVSEILDNGRVYCEWFKDDEPQGRAFPPEALKEWEPPSLA